jgi:hypothetical protein
VGPGGTSEAAEAAAHDLDEDAVVDQLGGMAEPVDAGERPCWHCLPRAQLPTEWFQAVPAMAGREQFELKTP